MCFGNIFVFDLTLTHRNRTSSDPRLFSTDRYFFLSYLISFFVIYLHFSFIILYCNSTLDLISISDEFKRTNIPEAQTISGKYVQHRYLKLRAGLPFQPHLYLSLFNV